MMCKAKLITNTIKVIESLKIEFQFIHFHLYNVRVRSNFRVSKTDKSIVK